MVSSGGSGYGDTVYSGGHLYVLSGGVDAASVVETHGTAVVSSGGTFSDGEDQGTLTVSAGGHVSGGLTISAAE